MHHQKIGYMSLLNLAVGTFAVLIASSIIGLCVNAIRIDHLSFTHPNAIVEDDLKRNEIIYVTSSTYSHITTGTYYLCDVRNKAKYRKKHIRNAKHYVFFQNSSLIQEPVIFYGNTDDLVATKKIIMQMLPKLQQPAYLMIDGIEGWESNQRVENSRD